MNIISIFFVTLLIPTSAFAYEGTYRCKSSEDLVNTYRFETVSIGNEKLPFIEATLHYHQNLEDKNSPIVESVTKGVAVINVTGDVEFLALNNFHFEFVKGQLSHCKQ
jgi:hypothetical protein